MKSYRFFSCLCAVVLLLSASGCGNQDTEPAETDTPVVTLETGTDSYAAMAGTSSGTKDTKTSSSGTNVSGSSQKSASMGNTTQTTAKNNTSADGNSASSNSVGQGSVSQNSNSSGSVSQNNNSSGSTSQNNNSSGNVSQNNNSSGGVSQNNSSNQTSAGNSGGSTNNTAANNNNNQQITAPQTPTAAPEATEPPAVDETIYITLNGSSAQVSDSNAVSVSGGVITILSDGRYEVSGTLNDGQIVVNAGKESKVNLHLNGAGITCSTAAPLYVYSADTCVLHLDSGSANYIQDTAGNTQSSAILSKDDLTIKGDGSLTVIGNVKHAIKASNDVKIKSGSLTVSAVSTAIYGEDSVQISGGTIIIPTCKDGIKASNMEEAEKGFVTIDGGYVDVQNAAGNGIEAITGVTLSGCTVNVHSVKKAVKCDYQSIAEGCLITY